MKYIKLTLLLGGLALLGASCNLFQSPTPVSDPADERMMEDLREENERLKEENEDLMEDLEDLEEEEDRMEEKDEDDDAMMEDDEMDEDESEEKNENERGREVLSPIKLDGEIGSKRIDIYVVSEEMSGQESPAFKFGCDEYLYPLSITLDEDKSQSDLATALVQLLTYRPSEDEGVNAVRGKGFILANVRYEDGLRVIELEADEVSTGGVCEDARIKAQIEETAGIYSDNFEIRLNGSAKEWECLFDGSGLCS